MATPSIRLATSKGRLATPSIRFTKWNGYSQHQIYVMKWLLPASDLRNEMATPSIRVTKWNGYSQHQIYKMKWLFPASELRNEMATPSIRFTKWNGYSQHQNYVMKWLLLASDLCNEMALLWCNKKLLLKYKLYFRLTLGSLSQSLHLWYLLVSHWWSIPCDQLPLEQLTNKKLPQVQSLWVIQTAWSETS